MARKKRPLPGASSGEPPAGVTASLSQERCRQKISSAPRISPLMNQQAPPAPESETDADLVVRSRRGCRVAFAELIRRHEGWLLNLVYSLVGSREEAEDLVQEAFIRAWQRLTDLRDAEAFGAWLRSIAVNLVLVGRRRLARRGQRAELIRAAHRAACDDNRDTDGRLAVRQSLLRMKPEQAVVLVLKEMQGLSYREIAETLGVPVGTVRSRLHYARASFRRLWEE